MDEFWVCQHCRSLNRAGTGRCYHCKQKFGSLPKPAPEPTRNPPPQPGPTPISASQTAGGPTPSYLSRPAALVVPIPTDGSIGASHESRRRFHRPRLTDPIRKRIAWALVTRQSVSVSALGYVTAAMLSLVLLDGLLLVANAMAPGFDALQSGSPQAAWNDLDPAQQETLQVLGIAFVAIGAVTAACFSIFVGLTTHNAPGLGAQTPMLSPYRAGVSWLLGVGTQAELAIGLVAPAGLVWFGYPIPGLILGIVVLELAQRRLNEPIAWLARPSRHLADLYLSLGIDGAPSALVVTLWSICFVAVNVLAIAIFTLPLIAVLVSVASSLTHAPDLVTWQATGYSPAQIGIAALVGSFLVAAAGTIALLIPITLGMVGRQRTRQTLARVGRARPWAIRPLVGETSGAAGPRLYDPYDQPDDHASLYSPSTTSSPSPAWSDEVSEEPPA